MPTIETCGPSHKRTTFTYTGSANTGVTLHFEKEFVVPKMVFRAVCAHFQNKTARGGFSMDKPPSDGIGKFVQQLGANLTPRHASFICAILQNEGLATCELRGNAVYVTFPALT